MIFKKGIQFLRGYALKKGSEGRNTSTIPELYIVGAGPGDPELITVKASKILQNARVVLYDNLVNKELLNLCPRTCEKIYVGKQPYGCHTSQEVIHKLIKEKAYQKGCIVRLKGGDPFIFGRGYEEMIFAKTNSIKAQYIPGITSMQAIGLDNIPLTHRGVCESIWVITGTKKDGSLSDDLKLAIKSNATVVIYMGMKKLEQIAEAYTEAKYGNISAAIIQHASLPHKKILIGKVEDLPKLAREKGFTHPAIIIIGKTVELNSNSALDLLSRA
jgi:uroporphyrin-III C-methyltransferase